MGTQTRLTLKGYLFEVEHEMGLDTFCKKIGAGRQSVYQWRLGMCLPNARKMKAIVRMSEGRVTYKTMIEDFVRAQQSRNARK